VIKALRSGGTGQVSSYLDRNANGYRLPTKAEWLKGARGGASGKRFPWSDANTISHTPLDWYSHWSGGMLYNPDDVSPNNGDHPMFVTGGIRSPVASRGALAMVDSETNFGFRCVRGLWFCALVLSTDDASPA